MLLRKNVFSSSMEGTAQSECLIEKAMSQGPFGDVHEVRRKGVKYVLKRIRCRDRDDAASCLKAAFRHHGSKHPRSIAIIDLFVSSSPLPPAADTLPADERSDERCLWQPSTQSHDDDASIYLCILTPFYRYGSLRDFVAERFGGAPLPIPAALRLVRNVASFLAAFHASHLVHMDIRPENILVDDSFNAVVADLGTIKRGGRVGNPPYMAPELVLRQAYGPPSDLWALGALLFHLVAGGLAAAPDWAALLSEADAAADTARSDSVGWRLEPQPSGGVGLARPVLLYWESARRGEAAHHAAVRRTIATVCGGTGGAASGPSGRTGGDPGLVHAVAHLVTQLTAEAPDSRMPARLVVGVIDQVLHSVPEGDPLAWLPRNLRANVPPPPQEPHAAHGLGAYTAYAPPSTRMVGHPSDSAQSSQQLQLVVPPPAPAQPIQSPSTIVDMVVGAAADGALRAASLPRQSPESAEVAAAGALLDELRAAEAALSRALRPLGILV